MALSTRQPPQPHQPHQPPDHWTPTAYNTSASFVPALATRILQWLDPQPTDRILDLGCGDGALTIQYALHCLSVVGIDSSPNLLSSAIQRYGQNTPVTWLLQDACLLEDSDFLHTGAGSWGGGGVGGFDQVFSNAALHWILRAPGSRASVLRSVHAALKPGGFFIFEMGGHGNVAEVHAALLGALVRQGCSIEEARDACPWFFPSEGLMRKLLVQAGFVVEEMECEYRPTRLTEEEEEGEGGLEGWVRLMGAPMLERLEGERREAAVREVMEVLQTVCMKEEEGGCWLGYVRLRAMARKV